VGGVVIQIQGLWWPDDVAEKWRHSLRHVRSIEWSIAACVQRRTAVQAGGNIGLWPRRLARDFSQVVTFEPDTVSRECLVRNVPETVTVRREALGAAPGACAIRHRSLGAHEVIEGADVPVTTVDALALDDLDLLQLDVEGYEWHALKGAEQTIARYHPLIQVELRGFTAQYGQSDAAVGHLLGSLGYRVVSEQPGNDFVFQWGHA
jgi:FkbM family methyltransferase